MANRLLDEQDVRDLLARTIREYRKGRDYHQAKDRAEFPVEPDTINERYRRQASFYGRLAEADRGVIRALAQLSDDLKLSQRTRRERQSIRRCWRLSK